MKDDPTRKSLGEQIERKIAEPEGNVKEQDEEGVTISNEVEVGVKVICFGVGEVGAVDRVKEVHLCVLSARNAFCRGMLVSKSKRDT